MKKTYYYQQILAEIVARMRRESTYSPEWMSSHVGLSCSDWFKVECGEIPISQEVLRKFASALDRTPESITDIADQLAQEMSKRGFAIEQDVPQPAQSTAVKQSDNSELIALLGGIALGVIIASSIKK